MTTDDGERHTSRPTAGDTRSLPDQALVSVCTLAAAQAAIYAQALGFDLPFAAWCGHPDGTAVSLVQDGLVWHRPEAARTSLTALLACWCGELCQVPLNVPGDLERAHAALRGCGGAHSSMCKLARLTSGTGRPAPGGPGA